MTPPDEHDAWEDLGPFFIQEDVDNLCMLSSFVRPLPPEEAERRSMIYREAGTLTPEMLREIMEGLG